MQMIARSPAGLAGFRPFIGPSIAVPGRHSTPR